MSIRKELRAELKEATRARDQRRLDVIRAIETELTLVRTGKGFSGEVDDDLYRQVIAAYVKKMQKAKVEFEKAGERGAAEAEKLGFEVDYLSRWLPSKLDESETRALVGQAIEELGITDPKQAGRVVGHLMKSHRDQLDGGLVKRLATEALSR